MASRSKTGAVDVTLFGAGFGADDTTAIRAAYRAAIRQAEYDTSAAVVIFPPAVVYTVSSVDVFSTLPIATIATGARFKLLGGLDVAAFRIAGGRHSWTGGDFVQHSSAPARVFDLIQAGRFRSAAEGVRIESVHARDVHQFLYADMDPATGHANYRHRLINCDHIVRLGGVQAGSYGVWFDGAVVNNSAGNDSRLLNCRLIGTEVGLRTNGVRTALFGCSIDGCHVGVELDGANQYSDSGCYFEYNRYHFRYLNDPVNPESHQTSFAGSDSGQNADFSIGELGGATGALGRHLLTSCFGIGTTVYDQLKPTRIRYNTDPGLEVDQYPEITSGQHTPWSVHNGVVDYEGWGLPNRNYPDGSTYRRKDGGRGSTFYVREAGAWYAK